jgi:16S rRNA (guanine(966)-N(2))-methyltransferase RsmD
MRITGGTFRSRPIGAPHGRSTRPTSDRVREALFGILTSAGAIESSRVLDLYAGTGALGLEALSRGAARATFVESAREALGVLRANIASLGVGGQSDVVAADLASARGRTAVVDRGPFDLVLADPPWAMVDTGDVTDLLASLASSGTFAEGATVVLEHSSRTPHPAIDGICHVQDRRYGDTTLAFYKTGILGPPRGDT